PDRERLFESVWTLDPGAVRSASRTCASVAAGSGVGEASTIIDGLAPPVASMGGSSSAASRLFLRVVSYMEQGLLR
ncbi:MAG TPA: hypothetical protein VIR30_10555, partial [Nocardioides sp.]